MTTRFLALLLLVASPALGIQCLYPDGDYDNSTYWWDTPGQSTTHYTIIDEDTTCNGTVTSDPIDEDDGSVYTMNLTAGTDPEVHTGHTWYCYAQRSSNKTNTFRMNLFQGTNKLNTSTVCEMEVTNGAPVQKWPAGGCTLTESEASVITDYADLNIAIYAVGTSPTNVYVDTCNMEVPDAPSAGEEMMVIGAP